MMRYGWAIQRSSSRLIPMESPNAGYERSSACRTSRDAAPALLHVSYRLGTRFVSSSNQFWTMTIAGEYLTGPGGLEDQEPVVPDVVLGVLRRVLGTARARPAWPDPW